MTGFCQHRLSRTSGGILRRALVIGLVVGAIWLWWQGGQSNGQVQSREQDHAAVPLTLVPAIRVNDQIIPLSNAPITRSLSQTSTPISTNAPISGAKTRAASDDLVLPAQLALARLGLSSGSLDGLIGSQTRAALRTYYTAAGGRMPSESNALAEVRATLTASVFTNYTVSSNDFARLLPLGQTWLAKSQQERLDHETILELVSERSWSHPNLIRRLNPKIDWNAVSEGVVLTVPNVEPPLVRGKAAFVRIFLGARNLQAFDENTNLLAHFPCSIAQRVEKRPAGEQLTVVVAIPDPNYTFDPEVFPESIEAQQIGRKLILQPGPNNPVGTVWIGLDKPGYGIHGTPRPEDVGRTESHGCFRLANWNAELLYKLVWVGLPVFVEP